MIKVERLTACIGAEVSGVSLGDASRDASLFTEIKGLLLKHRVLFFEIRISLGKSMSPLRAVSAN